MKFCEKCGQELVDEAVICPGCGCAVGRPVSKESDLSRKGTSSAVILGIASIITVLLFPLAGHIPSIAGIIFGAREYKQSKQVVGLVLSIIGEVIAMLSTIILFFVILGISAGIGGLGNFL